MSRPSNLFSKVNSTLFILTILSFGLGCSRKQEDKTNKLIIPLSQSIKTNNKIGTMSATENLFHIVVNVHATSAGGGVLAVYNWDGCDNGGCSNGTTGLSAPSAIELSVPPGNGRLIQMIAVYKSDTGGMSFKYDDTVVNVTGKEVSVVLSPKAIGGAAIGRRSYAWSLYNGRWNKTYR